MEPTVIPEFEVLLLKPKFGVSTVDAYKRWSDSKQLPDVRYEVQKVRGVEFINDLERSVFEKHLFLAEMKMWLLKQYEVQAAMMSGSGATVFAVLYGAGAAQELAERARQELDPTLWSWAGRTGS